MDTHNDSQSQIRAKQRGSARAEKRESDTDNGNQPQTHTDVDNGLGYYHGKNARADYESRFGVGFETDVQYSDTDCGNENNRGETTDETEFFADTGENKIVIAFGNAF